MKTNRKQHYNTLILFLAGLFFVSGISVAQETSTGDKTSAPYFFVQQESSETESLPLKATRAEATISGVIADVHLFQTYRNEGKQVIEAVYIFPASTRAAVYAMVMHIGEREITAVVQPRDLARQQYETAKQNGQTASLLEQQRPNVFTMRVGNILPGDEIKVDLRYTELLIPENNIYSFVLPAVVGPRYTGAGGEEQHTDPWAANPYLKEGTAPNYHWDVRVTLSAGMPIQALRSPSHDIVTSFKGKRSATVTLKNRETFEGDRDFILEYRLAGDRIETGLLLFRGREENFYLAMVQPPKQVKPEMIPPREYIFVVDVSGSMHGFPLDISKKLMTDLITALGPNEKFNILTFAGGSTMFSGLSVSATAENKKRAIAFMNGQQGGGGTELMPAIRKAMAIPAEEGMARSFVILTDGYVTVEKEAFSYVRDHLQDANFFAFGIGSSVNRYIIEGLAHAGMGTPFVVLKPEEAATTAKKFRDYVSTPLITGIKVTYSGFNAADQIPAHLPDMLGERPLVFFGKWDGEAQGQIRITGNDHAFVRTLNVSDYSPQKEHAALSYLWAREKIRLLDDFGTSGKEEGALEEEVTALGMHYNLLTRFTSFIALDSEIRNDSGKVTTVVQPLPLPLGVSNYAVGGVSGKSKGALGVTYTNYTKRYSGVPEREYSYDAAVSPESKVRAEAVYSPPAFTGGDEALRDFLKKNLVIPESLKKAGTHGVVFVRVTVDAGGKVIHVEVLRSLSPDADVAACNALRKTSGKWHPAVQNDKKVTGTVIIPVSFSY